MKLKTILGVSILFLFSLTIFFTAYDEMAQKDLKYNYLNQDSKQLISTYDGQYSTIYANYLNNSDYYNVTEPNARDVDAFYRQSAEDKGLLSQFKKFTTMFLLFPQFAIQSFGIPFPSFILMLLNLFYWILGIYVIIAIYQASKGDVGGKN